MAITREQSPFVIGAIAFVLMIGVAISYYLFSYLPEINRKPTFPAEWTNPPKITEIKIVKGAFDPNQVDNFVPKRITINIGIDNKVVWINEDITAHTVTSDTNYHDHYSGPFDSTAEEHWDELPPNGYLMPGNKWEFVFVEPGEYPYHCIPHPWMQGTIVVKKPTA
ncbi:Plastocyanin [archaeon HR05]|nr:Plastocyanin [archaeon HR05]